MVSDVAVLREDVAPDVLGERFFLLGEVEDTGMESAGIGDVIRVIISGSVECSGGVRTRGLGEGASVLLMYLLGERLDEIKLGEAISME